MGYRIIKRTLFKEPPLENPSGRVTGMGDRGGELFSKSSSYFSVLVSDVEKKVMR